MLQLPNGCLCSDPTVHPKNWDKSGASLKVIWYIQYYFHDPAFKDKYPNGCLRMLKGGLNKLSKLEERRSAVKILKQELLYALQNEGYNPITKKCHGAASNNEIDTNTPFSESLLFAQSKIKVGSQTALDIRSVIKYTNASAKNLRFHILPISQIRRKHIKLLLDNLSITKDKWSANQHNYYRAHLMMLFNILMEYDIIEINPVLGIKKQKHEHKIRETLTPEQRKQVDKYLNEHNYSFWRFLQIFFHSGARETELLRIQAKDVDLINQKYKLTIKKGRISKQVERTIKDIALPFWEDLLKYSKKDDFIFSKNLIPGPVAINSHQITRRWRTWVKEPMGITADFYSLKHLNLDETAAILDIQSAAAMAGHTSTVITMAHYATGEKERIHQRLKGVANSF